MTSLAAVAAAVLLGGFVVFQLALAAGAPLGGAAYGGRSARDDGTLPPRLRAVSGLAAVVLAVAAFVVLARGGVVGTDGDSTAWTVGTWVVAAYMALNTAGNLTSPHPLERYGFSAATAALTVLCAVVALS